MSINVPVKNLSRAAVVVAALFAGMIIAGGLDLGGHAAASGITPPAEASTSTTVATGQPFDFAGLAQRVVPSVVSVYSTDVVKPDERRQGTIMDPFELFFGPRRQPWGTPEQAPEVRQSAGSGFFITARGELLTNNHVIEDADKIEVELNDGTRYRAEVVGRDPATDVAVVRVSEPDRNFPVLPFGDSGALQVGEWVMAVGNPLNMDHTVTVGVVSAKGRVLGLADSSFENFIQTDAAINFGNSGGPLLDVYGKVVGINTAINAGGQNLGFAVPINSAKRILPQLRDKGEVVRGYLGAQVRDVSPEIQEAFGLDSRKGAFVDDVLRGHAAATAGLKHGDTIVAVDGAPVGSTRELIDTVSARPPGSKVSLDVVRDGKRVALKVKLEERPGNDELGPGAEPADDASNRAGLSVHDLSAQLRQVYRIDDNVDGVVITQVKPASPAGEAGLQAGDIIQEANGTRVSTTRELDETIDAVAKGELLRLYVLRPRTSRSFFAILRLSE